MDMPRFHLAIPVLDLNSTRQFYGELLQCNEGRSAERWIDWNFFGHQLSTHVVDSNSDAATNSVDGDSVPTRHFGCIVTLAYWHELVERLRQAEISFRIEPRVRFQGLPGEQYTFFVDDPAGNSLEFKAFENDDQIFSCD
jgi:hypothetical protein